MCVCLTEREREERKEEEEMLVGGFVVQMIGEEGGGGAKGRGEDERRVKGGRELSQWPFLCVGTSLFCRCRWKHS